MCGPISLRRKKAGRTEEGTVGSGTGHDRVGTVPDTTGANAMLLLCLLFGLQYFGPLLNTASSGNIFIVVSTNAKLYITLKNIAQTVPNFCQRVDLGKGFKERVLV